MSLFKSLLKQDVEKVFMNNDEFTDVHDIDGIKMSVLIDANELDEREKSKNDYLDGVYNKRILIYVKTEEFGAPPKYGSYLILDNKLYTVCKVTNEYGVYSITLEANKA